jgi:CMP-N-acetylneuraminic acid synthetase
MKKILTIIPARGGSKGIKNKNIKILDGKPLIKYSLDIAKKIVHISDICISTDSKKIKSIIKKDSINFYGYRPKNLSGDASLTIDVVKYELKKFQKIFKKKYEYILLLQPTCPIRNINHLKIIINTVMSKKNNYDSGVSVKKIDANHPFRMKVFKKNYLENFMGTKKEDMRPRQKLPPVYIRSGSYYFIKTDILKKKNSLVGNKCFGFILNDIYGFNIDDIDDFNLLKMKMKK